MISASGKRSARSQYILNAIEKRVWGLMILDEVHVVPANRFRNCLRIATAHCKLGLSATLVREDEMIEHLNFLIGPKLYEANWMDLQKMGWIANVMCAEVWCPMTPQFYREYLKATPRRKRLIYIMNPNKFRACEYLVRMHEDKGHKVIIFSDNVFALKAYSQKLKIPMIYGPTPPKERMRTLSRFKTSSDVRTIGLSKVGDNSIDLPEANVIIQISSHFGSRRQEAQRLGRILRPKSRLFEESEHDAFFYSLVSQDTQEMYYSSKRRQFLIDQGYAFKVRFFYFYFFGLIVGKVITHHQVPGPDANGLGFSSEKEQAELLGSVLSAAEIEAEAEELTDAQIDALLNANAETPMIKRRRSQIYFFLLYLMCSLFCRFFGFFHWWIGTCLFDT